MPKKTNTHFQNERNKNKMCIFPPPPQYLEHPDLSILPYATKKMPYYIYLYPVQTKSKYACWQ